ncbi:trypsin-like serine peptidase [Microtetraspora niveoalba]|uniref:trypsin-like serine peptidase n=1 Tax=Microtetraspora niveoalba TaxID=46175 RepID=UPI000833E748|nr:trypsin-like peptidase domain-containing protein [Microtetraspora niveoalba]
MSPSLLVFTASALVAELLGAPAPANPPTDVVEHTAAAASDAYWTPERMAGARPLDLLASTVRRIGALAGRLVAPPAVRARAARPMGVDQRTIARRSAVVGRPVGATVDTVTSGSRWTGGGAVGTTVGRVFLTLNGVDFVCSGTAVRSANKDVVATAGHCVKDGTGAWAENWMFVPGYESGRQPYGSYPARRMFVAGPWARDADDGFDVGMVAVSDRGGRHVADAVGAQAIGFDAARGQQTYAFGFPADPPYDGEHLLYCAGRPSDDPYKKTQDQGLKCDLTAGASGGPWFSGFDPATGQGLLTSVSSFKYSNDSGSMYGPYFGDEVRQVFDTAQRA